MDHINTIATPPPELPHHGVAERTAAVGAASLLHVAAAGLVLMISLHVNAGAKAAAAKARQARAAIDTTPLIFLAPSLDTPGGGGGGGGNEQTAPIRHASAVGTDVATVRVRKPTQIVADTKENADSRPSLVIDAKPLASGTADQIGLPVGGVSTGTSTGPGSGGGAGDGVGTGIGPGRGPGIGPGEGGGIGGGVYRAGGAVSAPRLLSQVQAAYTEDALRRRVQGTVSLEIIVRKNGCPSDIRVVHSLDRGLDEEAIAAVNQWRFAPGHLGAEAVDVLATVLVDFTIR